VLFAFPYSVFIDFMAVNGCVSGKGAVSVEIIPLAVELEPLTGHHQAVLGEIIGLFGVAAANVPPADQGPIAGVEAPVVAVLHPAGFQYAIGVEEVFYTVDGLRADEGFAIFIVEVLSGIIQCPTLCSAGVYGQLDVTVKHSCNLGAGGTGLWTCCHCRPS